MHNTNPPFSNYYRIKLKEVFINFLLLLLQKVKYSRRHY